MKAGMGAAEYARHASEIAGIEISRATIHARMKKGTIALTSDGKVDVEKADQEFALGATGRPRKEAPAAPEMPKDGVPTSTRSRQVIESINAARAMATWKREQGLMLDRKAVVKLLTDFAHRIRREMQSHPRKMQAELVKHLRCKVCGGDVDAARIAIAAERYVREVLTILADDPLGTAGT